MQDSNPDAGFNPWCRIKTRLPDSNQGVGFKPGMPDLNPVARFEPGCWIRTCMPDLKSHPNFRLHLLAKRCGYAIHTVCYNNYTVTSVFIRFPWDCAFILDLCCPISLYRMSIPGNYLFVSWLGISLGREANKWRQRRRCGNTWET